MPVQCSNEITITIINMSRKFRGRAGSPFNTMSPGPRPTSIPSGILIYAAIWPQQIWAENWGAVPLFLGRVERRLHLTQSRLGWGLAPYQMASWSMQSIGTTDMGWKLGGVCAPLGDGELGPHLTQCGQGWGLPACQVSSWSIQPFGHCAWTLQTDRTDNQTDNEPIA